MSTATQAYEEEQAKLQAELDGKHRDDIHITVPKEPEVNPEVYKDVEPMLYRGFLTISASINTVYFVFKSLNHHELELLKFSGGLTATHVTPAFWDTFLAYGVFMIDGVNVLADRDRWLPKISDTFEQLPKDAKSKIIRYVSEVNRRASNAVALTEAYAMELMSRYRWAQLRGVDLTSPAVTGIDGSQRLGLNWAQQLWRALNYFEDRNEEHEREWENAKFIGSCLAGKGISKVYHQDTERRRKEREERLSRKDKILREIVLGETVVAKTHVLPGVAVTAPRTVEELADQLEKDLRGDKDWHDRVIEDHERKVRQQYQARQTQLATIAQDNATRFGNRSLVGGGDLQGLTQQEVELLLERRKQLEAQVAARMQVQPDEKLEAFLDKWGVSGPEISSEISTTDQDISGAIPLVPASRAPVTPFRRK